MSKSEILKVVAPTAKPFNRIAIKHAYLHQAVMIPGLLATEKTLSSTRQPITLELGPEGLWIIPTDPTKDTAIVPTANVSVCVLK